MQRFGQRRSGASYSRASRFMRLLKVELTLGVKVKTPANEPGQGAALALSFGLRPRQKLGIEDHPKRLGLCFALCSHYALSIPDRGEESQPKNDPYRPGLRIKPRENFDVLMTCA